LPKDVTPSTTGWMEETLIPVHRLQNVLAIICAGCVVAAILVSRPRVVDVVAFVLVAVLYERHTSRRARTFPGGLELGERAQLERMPRLAIRAAVLMSPVVAVALAVAAFEPLAAMLICGLLAGLAASYVTSTREMRRVEHEYDIVVARRGPTSLRPRRRLVDVPVIVPLDPRRVDELVERGAVIDPRRST
jgi:hypothetical protein